MTLIFLGYSDHVNVVLPNKNSELPGWLHSYIRLNHNHCCWHVNSGSWIADTLRVCDQSYAGLQKDVRRKCCQQHRTLLTAPRDTGDYVLTDNLSTFLFRWAFYELENVREIFHTKWSEPPRSRTFAKSWSATCSKNSTCMRNYWARESDGRLTPRHHPVFSSKDRNALLLLSLC